MAAKKRDDKADRSIRANKSARMVKRKTVRKAPKKTSSLSEVVAGSESACAARPSLFHYTLIFIYKNLYILGISLMRRGLRYRRRLRRGIQRLKGSFYSLLEGVFRFGQRVYRDMSQKIALPFQRIRDTYQQQLPAIRADRVEGKFPVRPLLPVAEMVGRLVWKILSTLINYLAPVVAAVVLYNSVVAMLERPVALKLVYDGHDMGYVQNESVFDEAAQLVRDRYMDQDERLPVSPPSFAIEEVEVDELLSSAELADMLIGLSDSEIETAYGLFVGGELLGASTDKDAILNELTAIKEQNRTYKTDERVEFVKKIELKSALYPSRSVVGAEEIIEQLHEPAEKEEIYVVKAGDTPTEIAQREGMSYAELLRLNPTIEEDLKPGYELKTRVEQPFLSVKNVYTLTYDEDIPFETVEVENVVYSSTYRKVTQEGVDGERRVIAEVTAINGVEADRTILDDSLILKHPVTERITIGTKTETATSPTSPTAPTDMTPSTAGASASGFRWPTTGGTPTTYAGHSGNGVDIAVGAGVPIYAAKGGTVAKVSNGYTGYGHHIIIDHGDGFTTLYAHNSANYVSVGQRVEQGEVIAAMGRTGWATGNHLHFEVRQNGRPMYPLNYIG